MAIGGDNIVNRYAEIGKLDTGTLRDYAAGGGKTAGDGGLTGLFAAIELSRRGQANKAAQNAVFAQRYQSQLDQSGGNEGTVLARLANDASAAMAPQGPPQGYADGGLVRGYQQGGRIQGTGHGATFTPLVKTRTPEEEAAYQLYLQALGANREGDVLDRYESDRAAASGAVASVPAGIQSADLSVPYGSSGVGSVSMYGGSPPNVSMGSGIDSSFSNMTDVPDAVTLSSYQSGDEGEAVVAEAADDPGMLMEAIAWAKENPAEAAIYGLEAASVAALFIPVAGPAASGLLRGSSWAVRTAKILGPKLLSAMRNPVQAVGKARLAKQAGKLDDVTDLAGGARALAQRNAQPGRMHSVLRDGRIVRVPYTDAEMATRLGRNVVYPAVSGATLASTNLLGGESDEPLSSVDNLISRVPEPRTDNVDESLMSIDGDGSIVAPITDMSSETFGEFYANQNAAEANRNADETDAAMAGRHEAGDEVGGEFTQGDGLGPDAPGVEGEAGLDLGTRAARAQAFFLAAEKLAQSGSKPLLARISEAGAVGAGAVVKQDQYERSQASERRQEQIARDTLRQRGEIGYAQIKSAEDIAIERANAAEATALADRFMTEYDMESRRAQNMAATFVTARNAAFKARNDKIDDIRSKVHDEVDRKEAIDQANQELEEEMSWLKETFLPSGKFSATGETGTKKRFTRAR